MRLLAGSVLASALCATSAFAAVNAWSPSPLNGGYVGTVHYVQGRNDVALASAGNRIYRTADDGVSWTAIAAVANTSRSIAQDPTNASLVLVISEGHGVMRSDDAGEAFRHIGRFSSGVGGERAIAIAADGGAWYGSQHGGGVYRSTNRGETWEPRSNGLPTDDATVEEIIPDPTNAARLYALVSIFPSQSSTLSRHLYVTQDGGGVWSRIILTGEPDAYVYSFAINPANPQNVIATSAQGVHRSVTGGGAWVASLNWPYRLVLVRFDPRRIGAAYMVTDRGLVYRTEDAANVVSPSWALRGRVHAAGVSELTFWPYTFDRMMLTTSEGLYVSADGGATWTERDAGVRASSMHSLVAASDGSNRVFAMGHTPFGAFSRDTQTAAWSALGKQTLQQLFVSYPDTRALAIDPADRNILYLGGADGVYKSTDAGATWIKPSIQLDGRVVLDLAVDPRDSRRIYAAAYPAGVRLSTDAGALWSDRSAGLQLSQVHTLAMDPKNPDVLYAAGMGSAGVDLYKTVNGGSDWTGSGFGLDGAEPVKVVVDPVDSSILYAASHRGLYKSANAGAEWQRLGIAPVRHVVLDPRGNGVLYRLSNTPGVERSVDAGASWESVLAADDWIIRSMALDPARSSNIIVSVDFTGYAEFEIAPNLALSTSSTSLTAGSPQTVALQVRNNGAHAATAVDVSAALPASAANVSAQTGKGSCSVTGQQVLCRIGVLAANEQVSASITLTAAGTGQVSGSLSAYERDPAMSDNSITVAVQAAPAPPANPAPGGGGGGGGGGALALHLLLALTLLAGVAARRARARI